MSTNEKRDGLDLLTDVLVEDVLSMSDEDILTEVQDAGSDPKATAGRLRDLYEKTLVDVGKRKLVAAKKELERGRNRPQARVATGIEPKAKLKIALEQNPELAEQITLAARNGKMLSDQDIAGVIADLKELGVLDDDV